MNSKLFAKALAVVALATLLALVLPRGTTAIDSALAACPAFQTITSAPGVSGRDGQCVGNQSPEVVRIAHVEDQQEAGTAEIAASECFSCLDVEATPSCSDCAGITGCGGFCTDDSEYVCAVMDMVPPMPDPSGADPIPETMSMAAETYGGFSWRDHLGGDWTTPAKSQGNCGSCWAFAAIGALEAVINIKHGEPDMDMDLSEQYILSCLSKAGNCSGGTVYMTYEYIRSKGADGNYVNGIIPEHCFPYQASDTIPCSSKCADWETWLIPISGCGYLYPSLPSDRDAVKRLLREKGPLATYANFTSHFADWMREHKYPHDYYPYPGPVAAVNHAVVIVGYKDDPSIGNGGYWIVKNSWGPNFGYGGFCNVEYGSLRLAEFVAYVEYEPEPGPAPPYTWGHQPVPGATGVPLDTDIVVHVADDSEGVDASSIVMKVEGLPVTPAITGTPADYTLTYAPTVDFSHSQVVNVTVDASDLGGNVMPRDSYYFTTRAPLDVGFSALPVTGDEPLAVAFTDLSGCDDTASWLWSFGDGYRSTVQNPIHTYVQDGQYTVSLTVTEADGSAATETRRNYISVRDTGPAAGFSATPLSDEEPLTLVFADASKSYDGIVSWVWDFGDGHRSTVQNPQHTYAGEGLYNVTLTVAEKDGSQDTMAQPVRVGILGIEVTVTLSGDPLEGCEVYACNRAGTYAGMSRFTDAAGKATFTLADGSYKFLVYYNGTAWWSQVATVPGSACVDIYAETVVMVTVSGVPLQSYRLYCYTVGGVYVSYRFTNAAGEAAFLLPEGEYKFRVDYNRVSWWSEVLSTPGSTTIDIRTDDSTGPTADFSALPLAGDEPLRVAFTDFSTSYDRIESWLWSFGDGGTSVSRSPTHTYAGDGLYTVSLTVTEADGDTNTETKVDYISVYDTAPAADFSAVPLSGDEPLVVSFTDLSASYDGIASWLWSFGDGQTSPCQNPTHTYSGDGLYTVSLTVTEADGDTHTETKVDYISVYDTAPVADFSASPLSGDEPLVVNFTDLSASYDGIVSWLWSFGDGQTSPEQNPAHTYVQDGMYTVSLTVTEVDGDSRTKTRTSYMMVRDTSPVADFSAVPLSGDEPLTVDFTDLSASHDGIVSWLWSFGDGQTSREQNPAHTYLQDGLYTVSLTVTEVDRDTHTRTKASYIRVQDTAPVADFSASPLSGDEPLTVDFTDLSASYDGIASWLWSFGDGETSSAQSPTHTYLQDGLYTVSVTVTEVDGDSRTATRAGYVRVHDTAPVADFSAAPLGGDEPLTVDFTDLSASYDGTASWLWSFGDGQTSSMQNPVHTYLQDGLYTVSVTVTEVDGDIHTKTRTSYVRVYDTAPAVDFSAAPLGGDEPLTVDFTDLSASYDGIASWLWSFGDGQTSPMQHPRHTYGEEGLYVVSLTVTESDGSQDVSYQDVQVISGTRVTVRLSGEPLKDCLVYACTGSGAYAGQSAMTDPLGHAQFTLEDGTYKFLVYYDGRAWWSDLTSVPGTATIDITASTLVAVTAGEDPLSHYYVYAYTEDGTFVGCTKTDASGRARFNLGEGSYKFRVFYNHTNWWSEVVQAPEVAVIDIPY